MLSVDYHGRQTDSDLLDSFNEHSLDISGESDGIYVGLIIGLTEARGGW